MRSHLMETEKKGVENNLQQRSSLQEIWMSSKQVKKMERQIKLTNVDFKTFKSQMDVNVGDIFIDCCPIFLRGRVSV